MLKNKATLISISFLILSAFFVAPQTLHAKKELGDKCNSTNSCDIGTCHKGVCQCKFKDGVDCELQYGVNENWKCEEGGYYNYCENQSTSKRIYPNQKERKKIGGGCSSNSQCLTAYCNTNKDKGLCACYDDEDCARRYGGSTSEWECDDEYKNNSYICINKNTGVEKKPSESTPASEEETSKLSEAEMFDERQFMEPGPEIDIPGLNFSPTSSIPIVNQGGAKYVVIPYLGEYISTIYKWGVGAAGILAVIMIIISGIQWMFPFLNKEEKQDQTINKAKKQILGSLIGLILAVGSYTLLYTINPELVEFDALQVKYIKYIEKKEIRKTKEETADTSIEPGENVTQPDNSSQVSKNYFVWGMSVNGESVNRKKAWNAWSNASESKKEEMLKYLYNPNANCGDESSMTNSISGPGIDLTDQKVHKNITDDLKKAGKLANKLGYSIAVGSGKRSIKEQAQIWNTGLVWRSQKLDLSKREWSGNQGKIASPSCEAPHLTGGAIDISFYKKGSNSDLLSKTDDKIYSINEYKQEYFNQNLDALLIEEIMRRSNFVRYCAENWHFESEVSGKYTLRYHAAKEVIESESKRCGGGGSAIWEVEIPQEVKKKINNKVEGTLFEL